MGWEQIEQSDRLKARAKHDLANKNPSLKTTLAHYREQQENRDNSASDRRLWKALADELEERMEATRKATTTELLEQHEPLF